MKRILAILCAAMLVLALPVLAEELHSEGFVYTSDGIITASETDGIDVLKVPSKLGGTTITEIGAGAFAEMDINTVYIEEGIKVIGENAFARSNVEYVDIPAGVTTVKKGAFDSCGGLSVVIINSPDTVLEAGAFANTDRIHISLICTVDKENIVSEITRAKGDGNFEIHVFHTALVESMFEKDVFGDPILYCEKCGYKGSINYDETYLPFSDVDKAAWYFPYVSIAYMYDIIKGKTPELFCPEDSMTLAETCKIAACLNALFAQREDADFEATEGEPWYMPYVNYCETYGVIEKGITFEWENKATRAQVAYFFSRCYDFDEYILNPDVPLSDIPDVDEKTLFSYYILDLFRRGIATGSDEYYTFYPESYVKRCEAATLISRILREDLRKELPKG